MVGIMDIMVGIMGIMGITIILTTHIIGDLCGIR